MLQPLLLIDYTAIARKHVWQCSIIQVISVFSFARETPDGNFLFVSTNLAVMNVMFDQSQEVLVDHLDRRCPTHDEPGCTVI